jgi:hypothetical protein
MTLRTPNDPNYPLALLTAVKYTILAGTQFEAAAIAAGATDGGLSRVYIRDLLSLSRGDFPAINIHTGPRMSRPNSQRTSTGQVVVILDYYDAWTENPATLVQIRAQITEDCERIYANLESNPTLDGRTSTYTTIEMGPDMAQQTDEVPGVDAIKNYVAVSYTLMPYDW